MFRVLCCLLVWPLIKMEPCTLATPQGLLKELVANCDGALKSEVTQVAAAYEHRLQLGSKVIYHIEAFIARFMAIYKGFMEEGMADMMVM